MASKVRVMALWKFTLVLVGRDTTDGETIDRLLDAGCDDATFGWSVGVQHAGFDREAASLEEAVRTAVLAVESVGGIEVAQLIDDSTVTEREIASYCSRQLPVVRALIDGRNGPGNFPEPYSLPDESQREWAWRDVASWFSEALGEPIDQHREQPYGAIAKLIEARHHYRKQDPAKRRELTALLNG